LKENQHDATASRPQKLDLLPEVARLAAEGLCAREIAEKIAAGKSTVNKWLRQMQGKRAKKSLDPAEVIRQKIAYYRCLFSWESRQASKSLSEIETIYRNKAALHLWDSALQKKIGLSEQLRAGLLQTWYDVSKQLRRKQREAQRKSFGVFTPQQQEKLRAEVERQGW
jgi:transposase